LHAADWAGQVKAIVATQRDYGRRDDRRQSRLKYLVHEWGVDKFRCAPTLATLVCQARRMPSGTLAVGGPAHALLLGHLALKGYMRLADVHLQG